MWVRGAFGPLLWRWYSKSKSNFRLSTLCLCLKSSRSFHNHARVFSILKPSFITDLSLDIDIDGLKAELEWQKKLGKNMNVTIHKLVSDALERKCSDVINDFSVVQARMFKTIQLEYSFLHAEGHDITDIEMMTNKNWIEAMTFPSIEERLHYYLFIQHKANLKAEQAKSEETIGKADSEIPNESFILHQSVPSRFGDHSLASAMTHGIPLVFDMGFNDSMTQNEFGYTAKQLWLAYLANRNHRNPFHFIFTDCAKTNNIYRTLELRHLLQCQHFLVSETEESYIDLFDRSKLVYLSPNAKHVLSCFDPSCVYILGAYSDMKQRRKFGPAKAREQGIKCLKFPIDNHVRWMQGSKDFELPQVVNVLLSLNSGMEWKDAFANVLIHGKNFRHYGE